MSTAPRRLGVLMDPIAGIKPYKDSTLAMLLEATRRGWALDYIEHGDLALRQGEPWARLRPLQVTRLELGQDGLGGGDRLLLAGLDRTGR